VFHCIQIQANIQLVQYNGKPCAVTDSSVLVCSYFRYSYLLWMRCIRSDTSISERYYVNS